MTTEDDGFPDDPLLFDRSWAVSSYRPDFDALVAAPTRIVIAVGEESMGTFTGRTSVATAELLGQQATVSPSHRGGFMGGEFGYPGQPEASLSKNPAAACRPSNVTHPQTAGWNAAIALAACSMSTAELRDEVTQGCNRTRHPPPSLGPALT
jgi:hypothetical protein